MLHNGMYVTQEKASTIAVECSTLGEKYLKSFRYGSDLFGTDKVEEQRLHTRDKALKFLIRNVV